MSRRQPNARTPGATVHGRVMRRNDVFQEWLALKHNRQKRHRRGLFLVEGTTAIDSAVAHGWQIEDLLYPSGQALSTWAAAHLEHGGARRAVEVDPALLGELTERHEGTELLAVVRRRTAALEELELATPFLLLVMDRPKSPGNLGSVIRSAAAFGVTALVITGHAADPFEPAAVRASVGALFTLPLISLPSHAPLLDWLSARRLAGGVTLVGTGQFGSVPLHEVPLQGNLAIVLGNETAGLSRAYEEACDRFVRIPTDARQGSLNVVAAAAVILYEVRRQRLFC